MIKADSGVHVLEKRDVQSLVDLFDSNKKENVAIICHDQPDPDCLASAMAVKAIADFHGIKASIYYGGEIPYTQNSVMMNVLNISAIKLEADEGNEDESTQQLKAALEQSYIIVVDTSCFFGKENNIGAFQFIPKDKQPDLVIDHHAVNNAINCPYIHKSYGSCSTIMYEVLRELDISISKDLATGLYLGISTDTADLKSEGTTENDRVALDELRKMMDVEILRKIYDYPKPLALLELRKRAYNSYIICGNNLIIANVGIINPQQRALLAILCEEILGIESVDSVMVIGVVDEGLEKPKFLISSFRTQVLAINVSQFIHKVFGKKHGGGRRGAGASKVPLEQMLCSAIDFAKRQDADSLNPASEIIGTLFSMYANRVKEEKNNI